MFKKLYTSILTKDNFLAAFDFLYFSIIVISIMLYIISTLKNIAIGLINL